MRSRRRFRASTPARPRPARPARTSTSASPTHEGAAAFEVQIDGGGYTASTSPKAFTNLADGSHTFAVRAVDAYGNTSSAVTRTWTVDAVAPPVPTIDSGPAAASTSSRNVSFGFSDTEGTATFEVQIDGGGYTGSTSPKAYTNLADGSHTFDVRALDGYGNTSAAVTRTWTVDAVAPPVPSIDSGPAAASTSGKNVSFGFSDTEGSATFEVQIDGGGYTASTSPKAYSNLADGSHTFNVRALDAYGNTSSAVTRTWTVDSIAPDTTITSNPTNPTPATTAAFGFTATETGSSFQCSLDGAAFAACTSPQSYSGLAATSHTFQVKATDAAGNTDATPASYTWTVQASAPPTVTSNTPTGTGASILVNPAVTFSRAMNAATITTSSFTLTPNGGAPVAATVSCNTPCTNAMLTPSAKLAPSTTYTAQITTAAKSADGMPLASPVTWSFTTTNAPEVASKSPSDGATNVPTGTSTGTPVSATFTRPMNRRASPPPPSRSGGPTTRRCRRPRRTTRRRTPRRSRRRCR